MADAAKYAPINGGNLIKDFKAHFSFSRTQKTLSCAYGFVFVFIAFTIFMAFSPSPNSSSPLFTNIFSLNSSSSTVYIFSDQSYKSHFSSFFSYFFQNSTNTDIPRSQNTNFEPPNSENHTQIDPFDNKNGVLDSSKQSEVLSPVSPVNNQTLDTKTGHSSELTEGSSILQNSTQSTDLGDKDGILKANQRRIGARDSPSSTNQTVGSSNSKELDDKDGLLKANRSEIGVPDSSFPTNHTVGSSNVTGNVAKGIEEKNVMRNFTSSPVKKQSNGTDSTAKQGIGDLVESLMNCDLFDGNWVRDESYPLYEPGSCSLIDEQFNCYLNGRPDHDFYKLKWKPRGCTLPRLNGSHMLELLRGKRLVFVGDSLNRNMWESLVCILKNSVKDETKVHEEYGRHHFRTEASYSFIFDDYNCSVEFFVAPFLVQESVVSAGEGMKKETLRLDTITRSAYKFKTADFVVFNTGHWWTHEKTSLGKDYYQEGSHVYEELNVLEAFRRALTTWGRWVDANIDRTRTHVFFRGYSASHFSGGQWNSGGQCHNETEPIKNETYLSRYPPKMEVLEGVLRGMKTSVSYLNVTRLTDYRKDGHPSAYRKQKPSVPERKMLLNAQDCSHWCLPGVPDAWNELLYAELLVRQNKKRDHLR